MEGLFGFVELDFPLQIEVSSQGSVHSIKGTKAEAPGTSELGDFVPPPQQLSQSAINSRRWRVPHTKGSMRNMNLQWHFFN
jgi:hypothetical protein